MPPLEFPLRQHGRHAYSPIVDRPTGTWPNGRGLAVYVALNLEHYAFGEGLVEDIAPGIPAPDVLNNSWREYGNRVGAWRLLELLQQLALPITLLINSELYGACPQLVAAFRAGGAEIAAHAFTAAGDGHCAARDDRGPAVPGAAAAARAAAHRPVSRRLLADDSGRDCRCRHGRSVSRCGASTGALTVSTAMACLHV